MSGLVIDAGCARVARNVVRMSNDKPAFPFWNGVVCALVFPLQDICTLNLTAHRQGKERRSTAVDRGIPNGFFGQQLPKNDMRKTPKGLPILCIAILEIGGK